MVALAELAKGRANSDMAKKPFSRMRSNTTIISMSHIDADNQNFRFALRF